MQEIRAEGRSMTCEWKCRDVRKEEKEGKEQRRELRVQGDYSEEEGLIGGGMGERVEWEK